MEMTDSLGLQCMERMLDPKLRSGFTAAPPSSATSWYRVSKNVTQPVWATKSAFVKMRGLEFTKLNAMFRCLLRFLLPLAHLLL